MLVRQKTYWPIALACSLLGYGALVGAEEDEAPDIEFLEYLGSWEESDEDWLIVERAGDARREVEEAAQSDTVPEHKESPERQDES